MDRLSPLLTLANLLRADSVSSTLDNQKNEQRDAVLHHEALPSNPLCPCKAAACRLAVMRLADPTNPNAIISLYARHKHISATMAGILQKSALRSML